MIQISIYGDNPTEEIKEFRELIEGGAAPASIYDDVAELQDKVAAIEGKLDVNYITGAIVPTNELADDKRIYCKTVNVGALPNATVINYPTGLNMNEINVERIEGVARNSGGTTIQLPNATQSTNYLIGCYLTAGGNIQIGTNLDRSDYKGVVRIYFTYK